MGSPDVPDHSSPRRRSRTLVTPERLLQLLNQRLAGYGHCPDCRLTGPIRPLGQPDDDGRNWSRYIALVCANQAGPGCARLADRIIDDATKEFNVLWPGPGANSPPL